MFLISSSFPPYAADIKASVEVFAVLKRFTCGTCVLLYSTRGQWIIPVNDFQMFHTAPLLQYHHLIQYDVTSLYDEPQDMIEHVIIEIIAHKSIVIMHQQLLLHVEFLLLTWQLWMNNYYFQTQKQLKHSFVHPQHVNHFCDL